MQIDLENASYEEFVEFVFAHPAEEDDDRLWYWNCELDINVEPRRVVAYLTRLLRAGQGLLGAFTLPQIVQGFEFLFGYGSYWFSDQVWNAEVPWADRRACILAVPVLYRDILEQHDAGGFGFMLWDTFAYGYSSGSRDPIGNPEDARVQEAMFEAMKRMLQSNNAGTQIAALHGLGHLRHTDSNRTIQSFLRSGQPASAEIRSYAAHVLEGRFL